jgi:hypothetical protein
LKWISKGKTKFYFTQKNVPSFLSLYS